MNRYTPGTAPICPGCKKNAIRTIGAQVCYQCKGLVALATARGTTVDALIAARDRQEETPPEEMQSTVWRDWIQTAGQVHEFYRGPKRKKGWATDTEKILVIPDLHVPFQHREAIAHMIERDGDADRAVVMGDVGDAFALSRFIKYEYLPYEQEIVAVRQMFELLSSTFPVVELIEGNHDGARLEKMLRGTLNSDFIAAINLITSGNLSPVSFLASKFKNIRLSGHEVDGRTLRWFTQIGDVVFTHAETFSRVPGAAMRRIEEWITDMDRTLQLKPWRVIIQAHTHQLGAFPWMADKLMVECGCLCRTHGYQLSPKLGGRPQRLGYVTLQQVRGVTDLNSVRTVWLDDLVARDEAQQAPR